MLYENGDHREAAAFLRRLSPSTFKTLLPMVIYRVMLLLLLLLLLLLFQIPADLFIESMPHSLPILEALYSKLFLAGDKIWQVIGMWARTVFKMLLVMVIFKMLLMMTIFRMLLVMTILSMIILQETRTTSNLRPEAVVWQMVR